ncbi:MAG: hypothetical protein IJ322_02725 [Clostridia bacterium]|nr:hypothetical protein [Clostridia bacterium]
MKKLSLVLVITLLSLCCLVAGCNTPCMHSYTTQEGPNYIVITPPTSTTAGVAQQSCLNCGYIQNVAIPATGQPAQHTCTYKCVTCQKCTNTQCTENVCADKCLGHVPPHTCEHKCVICQKCTDTQCTDDVCADKCLGHLPPHQCESICDTCGLCTNQDCTETVCEDKCLGHNPPHTCTYMCPICDKCTNTQCTEDVCADKCLGHNQTPPTHTCESVCDTCGKCTDASCTEDVCSNKCQGHTITPPAHTCTSICSTCGKCTDQSCAEAICEDKCQGHSTSTENIQQILEKYQDYADWNFKTKFTLTVDGEEYVTYYQFLKEDLALTYEVDGVNYTDYVRFTETDAIYYYQNDDGTYTAYSMIEDESTFYELYNYVDYFELCYISEFKFSLVNGSYLANNVQDTAKSVFGDYEGDVFSEFSLKVANGFISEIHSKSVYTYEGESANYTYDVELYGYGTVNFDIDSLPLEGTTSHTCTSKCSTCGLCTDTSCTEDVCSNKCQGHTITPPAHSCTSICSTCGKCTDQSCAEAVCTDKCQGHSTTPSQSLTATFTDAEGKQLYTDNSKLTFTASIAPYGYDAQKAGVQFTQNSGTAVVTSDQTLTGVTSITVKVQTNQTSGMTVAVKVGSTTFTTSNNKVIKDDGITDIVFTSSTAASGKLSITLEPTSSSKSMYLMAVTVNGASGGQGSEGGTSTNVMPQQQYNANNFDDRNLQELMTSFEFSDGTVGESIGLLSEGTYNALVIPVAFTNYSFTQQELANLNIAFNGTEAQTGWESVKTYYQQSSYGKLNITFDITDVFTAANSAAYYDYSNDNTSGSEQLLLEALEHFDGKIDYSKYDVDNDGCIDAVYLIYAAPVDYESDSSEYWAFVTWSYAEDQFDQLYPYYYLFAGKDFMLEGTSASKYPDDEILEGMIVNASTYIHETGHLLSLDDYYDYDESAGSNQGLGCADMMDSTVGDHSSYSKIMLGWLTPTIVTQSGTYTIDALSQNASCLLIPLDFNNSYFCEYLLVDLYADSGLNDLHGGFEGSLLYDIAEYGVRIYHVSNWVTNPYENEYGSYTDNNNTSSDIALIRLVEADGTIGFSDTVEMYDYQFAMDYDLWQAGDSLLKVFPNFARYDNKLVNFDIIIDSVSMDQATVTVTFNN